MYRFIELSEVLEVHAESLRIYGGSAGTRDAGLVESALGCEHVLADCSLPAAAILLR